jgi:hypothetical protein
VREEQTKQGQLTVSKKTKARLGEWQAEELRVGGGYECLGLKQFGCPILLPESSDFQEIIGRLPIPSPTNRI